MSPSSVTSPAFRRLVQTLKKHKKTVTVAEQCCGGLIQAGIMAQPGASSVFVGGSVAYNTQKSKPLLLNDADLHKSITSGLGAAASGIQHDKSTEEGYIASKFDWTSKVATAFCHELKTDYALAEGGATGPTFNPRGMETGFAVLSVAGKAGDGDGEISVSVSLQKQELIRSPDNDREGNMRRFADAAAELLTEVVEQTKGGADCNPEANTAGNSSASDHTDGHDHDNDNDNDNDNDQTVSLDRATFLRADEAALDALKPLAKYVLIRGTEMLFRSPTELAFLSHEDTPLGKSDSGAITTTFMGRLSDADHTPVFSLDLLDDGPSSGAPDGCFYANARTSAPLLASTLENELVLHAMAYANWQRSSKHCSSCGSPLELVHGGTAQVCNNDSCLETLSWPRQDPSIIVSVSSRCRTKLLLARSHRHPPKMHTVLAGFVEAGESFESAVAREVYEETGVRVDPDSIEYVASQPWPFPRSTMIAFSATADAEAFASLEIDETELVEAGWFDRADVREAARVEGAVMDSNVARKALEKHPTLPLLIPPKQVVARKLIDRWLSLQ